MAGPVAVPAVVSGVPPTSTYGQAVKTDLDFLTGLSVASPSPKLLMAQTTAQSFATGTAQFVVYDAADVIDNQNGHTPTTGTAGSKYVAPVAGWYAVSSMTIFAAPGSAWGAAGTLTAYLAVNGTQVPYSFGKSSVGGTVGVTTVATADICVYLNVNDYLQVSATQNSGGALSTAVGSPNGSSCFVTYLGAG